MPLSLARYPFTSEDWEDVQSFDCGSKEHQLEVSDWLKGGLEEDSALAAISRDTPARVWLYRLEDDDDEDAEPGEIVGFGALGDSAWRWTKGKDPFVPITTLIWFGVQNQFKRQPPGNEESYYSSQIMDDLIAIAMDNDQARPILGLCVRPDNNGAITLYRRKGFTEELSRFKDKQTQVEYLRMAKILNAKRVAELVAELAKKK